MPIRYGSPAFRHDGDVSSIAVSPGGRFIAASATLPDDTAIWDRATGERVLSIDAPASSLAWSADGRDLTLAFAWVSTWDVASGDRLSTREELKSPVARSRAGLLAARLENSNQLHIDGVGTVPVPADGSVVFDATGEHILACAQRDAPATVVATDGTVVASFGKNVSSACFAATGHVLLLDGAEMVLWDLATGVALWTREEAMKRHVVASPDGRWAALVGTWGEVDLVDVATGRRRRLKGATCSDGAVAFIDAETLALGVGHRVALHSIPGGEAVAVPAGHDRAVRDVAVARSAPVVATAGGDGTARTWDLHTGEPLRVFVHDNAVGALAISADGSELLTSAADDQVRLWGSDGSLIRSFPSDERSVFDTQTVAFSPSERYLIADVEEGALVWDRELDHRHTLQLGAAAVAVGFLDDELAVILTADTLYVCTFSGEVQARHTSTVELQRLAVCRADSLIVVADDGERTHGFRYREKSLERVFRVETGVATTTAVSDHGLVATGRPSSIDFYDHVSGEAAGSIPVPHVPRCLRFMPGDDTLLVGWPNGTASRVSVPATPRQEAERAQEAIRARADAGVALLRAVDRRRPSAGGYRGAGPVEGMDADGLGVTLSDGVHLRLSMNGDAMTLTIRCDDPAPAPRDDGLFARLGRWMGGNDDTVDDRPAFLEGLLGERSATAELREGPAGAELIVSVDALPEPADVREWLEALQARFRSRAG